MCYSDCRWQIVENAKLFWLKKQKKFETTIF